MKTITLQTILEAVQGSEKKLRTELLQALQGLQKGQQSLEKGQQSLEKGQQSLEKGQQSLEKRLSVKIESEVENLARITSKRFDGVEGRLDKLEKSHGDLVHSHKNLIHTVNDLSKNVDDQQKSFDADQKHNSAMSVKIFSRLVNLEDEMVLVKRRLSLK